MTLLTPGYALPYQVSTDEPCAAPEVWCDFASGVNDAMGNMKNIVDRVEPAVPIAVVGLVNSTTDIGITGGVIPFDTVYSDTDRMVDFDFSTRTVFPRRPGVYAIAASATVVSLGPAAFSPVFTAVITSFTGYPLPYSSTGGAQTARISEDVIGAFTAPTAFRVRAWASANVTTADLNLSAGNLGGFGLFISADQNSYRVSASRMGVYYLRDVA